MESEHIQSWLPFQLQHDRPFPFQIKLAVWNPDKDLLAMVTDDSKVLLHRLNWQRLWMVSHGRCVVSLCWRPDGKVIAVGLEDGTISQLDVEKGKLLRSLKYHTSAVVHLNWESDSQLSTDDTSFLTYEDRASRFFPAPPKAPQMPNIAAGDTASLHTSEDLYRELSDSLSGQFNVLCSLGKDGSVFFTIFGIFPIAKISVRQFFVSIPLMDSKAKYELLNASVYQVALSKDLCHFIIICSGELNGGMNESTKSLSIRKRAHGLHGLTFNTSIFWMRKNELHQLCWQAFNIDDLIEVIRTSLSVMTKQWFDAMSFFHEKFDSLATLIVNHGLDSSPQEELLSLLCGSRISLPIHQFLVNSLGEVGVKRVSKIVCGTAKELHHILFHHLQPAVEIIGFRVGELKGLSKWRARFQIIGLDEMLIGRAAEKSGMMQVQVERFKMVLSSVEKQFSNFFNWLLKSIKIMLQEQSDQQLLYNSELVAIFLKSLYDQDPVRKLLSLSEGDYDIEVDWETMERVREIALVGGFSDCNYLKRTLSKEFQQMEASFKEAFRMPFTKVSQRIHCENFMHLYPLPPSLSPSMDITLPLSISSYEATNTSKSNSCEHGYVDYMGFLAPSESSKRANSIVIIKGGLMHGRGDPMHLNTKLELILLTVPAAFHCLDLAFYKHAQLVLLLNRSASTPTADHCADACLMILNAAHLPFLSISTSPCPDLGTLLQHKDFRVSLETENTKMRNIPHWVTPPLAVSASRGVACVFTEKKRVLVYILEEDEEAALHHLDPI